MIKFYPHKNTHSLTRAHPHYSSPPTDLRDNGALQQHHVRPMQTEREAFLVGHVLRFGVLVDHRVVAVNQPLLGQQETVQSVVWDLTWVAGDAILNMVY